MDTPTLLAFDDDLLTLDLYRCIFESRGFKVVTCDDPSKVMDVVKTVNPECILMDLCMPDVSDGIEATRLIKKDPSTQDIPVIVITGELDEEIQSHMFNIGATDFVPKPFDATDIVERIKPVITLSAVRKLTSKLIDKF